MDNPASDITPSEPDRAADFCECVPDSYATAALGLKGVDQEIKSNVRTIDFGEVLPGTEATKSMEIKSNQDKQSLYQIHRVSYVNDIYQSFHFNKYNVTLNPGTNAQLKITYIPLLENDRSSDCFHIFTRDSQELEKINLKGHCLGTRIKCSIKNLFFIATPNAKRRANTFELKNISKVPATFQLDINDNEELFQVDISNGQIQPKKSIYLTVTFNGKIEGLHYKRLVILIFKHEPIMVDLLGIYDKNKEYPDDMTGLTLYPNEANSVYSAYFNDYGFSDEKLLPFKLNHAYSDFGRVLPHNYGKSQNRANISVAILKNNMQHDISVIWYKDRDNIFQIYPSELNIRPDESGYFEVTFNPDFKDHMYCKVLTGQVYWKEAPRPNTPVAATLEDSEENDNIPLPISLTVTGHSFPENQSWISAVEVIPSQIVFPACIPGYQSFATFMLKSDGHLPILFKFIPPKKSNFVVKPMVGMMRFTKLFVAKLVSGLVPELYREEWRVEINGEPQKYCKIMFQGQSEIPSIVVGKDNTITFNATLPGCQDVVTVPVVNTSCYHLRIGLIERNEYFHSSPSELELYPNEEANTQWTFNGKLDVSSQSEINCSMRVISNVEEWIGLPFEVQVMVNAHCEYSQICATPRYMDFGDVQWGSFKEVQFKIFNFGNSAVCYSLKAISVSEGVGHDDIHISNIKGKLCPNDKAVVNISFKTETAKEHVIQIVYFTRVNEFAEAVTTHPPVDLFSMRYNCIHPALQIEECVEHDLGRNFSKHDLWHMFGVNKINEELIAVKEGETKDIKLVLPSAECHDKIYRIRFVLRNITKFDITATLTRIRKCQCQPTEISKSLSFRQKVFQCPHRSMVTMQLSGETIVGRSFQFLDIYMNFNLTTKEEVAYDMKLTEDRHILFCFQMNNIPRDMKKISAYNFFRHKRFLNMFIGAKEPPYQTYWLYNNTSQTAAYELVDQQLNALNGSEGFPVISCFNNKGTVQPFSSKAILFRFHPIEAKKYQVTLPLILGSEKISITLSGRGAYKYDHKLIHKFSTTMPKISLCNGELPVTLSVDLMMVEAFPVWSTVDKMIHIRNVTKDRVLEYTWQKCSIDGIIEITVDESSGILHSEETVAVLLKLTSLGNPAISTKNLQCRIVDVTQNEIHEKSVQEYKEKQDTVDQYFIIDEKGTRTVKNDYKIEPPSEEFYVSVAITFHTISSLEIVHYLDVDQFLSQNPHESFEIEVENFMKSFKDEDAKSRQEEEELVCKLNNPVCSQIMECLIMDTLRSPIFEEMLQCQQKSTPPYYIQFKQDEPKNRIEAKKARIAEIKKHFAKPPIQDISDTFKYLIKDTVEQIFF